MAATTINNYGVELNQGPPGNPQTYAPLRANQLGGRVRWAQFQYVAASDASGQNIALCKLPAGARIKRIAYAVSASTGSATLAWGLAGANGDGFVDNGTGANTVGSTVSDSVNALGAAAANTSANMLTEVLVATPVAYSAAPASEGVVTLSGSKGWMYMLAKDCYLTVTVGTAALTTQIIQGFVEYILD